MVQRQFAVSIPGSLLLGLLLCLSAVADAAVDRIWKDYSPESFERAARNQQLILLNVVVPWCHDCQRMDVTTYRDRQVRALMIEQFVPIRVDADSRPDIADRYRDFGHPATIILTTDGKELVQRRGYIDAPGMVEMLAKVASNPVPESTFAAMNKGAAGDGILRGRLLNQLLKRHVEDQDSELGGLAHDVRSLDRQTLEWDLYQACRGDRQAEQRARKHLDAARKLIDPAFGGAYEASLGGGWTTPRFGKPMAIQWEYMLAMSSGCRQLGDEAYCQSAHSVARYLLDYLRAPGGAFFSSQESDLIPGKSAAEYFALSRDDRLNVGLPEIDKSRYGAANGQAIEGLVSVYAATNKHHYLTRAKKAMEWIHDRRITHGGGYRHVRKDDGGPYLIDTLHLARANLALYQVTREHMYLDRAFRSAEFMDRYFRVQPAGFISAVDSGMPLKPVLRIEQNILAAEFFLSLAAAIDDPLPNELAVHAMRFLATQQIADSGTPGGGILMINERLQTPAGTERCG